MPKAQSSPPPSLSSSDDILHNFWEDKQGEVFLIATDTFFYKTIQSIALKTFHITRPCVAIFSDMEKAFHKVRELHAAKTPLILVVERMLDGAPTTDFISSISNVFPDVKSLVLTEETGKDELAFLHEAGASSVLTKPASIKDIIEKLAFVAQPPHKLHLLMEEGQRLLALGEVKKVLNVCNKVLENKPGSPAGLMLMGDAYLALGERSSAAACYKKAHNSSKLYLKPIEKLAEFYKGENDDECLKYLKTLNELSPMNIKRLYEIGKIFARKGDIASAEQYFEDALRLGVKDSVSFVDSISKSIADTLADVSPELSMKYVKKFVEFKQKDLSPSDMRLFNHLGIALRKQGRWQAAIENYNMALEIDPFDPGIHYNKGMANFDGKQFHEAVLCFDRALELNPELAEDSRQVANNIGRTYYELNEYAKALSFFKLSLQMAPDDKIARTMVARIRTKVGK